MLNTPFTPWPMFTEDEIQAVSNVLRSNKVNYWTGEECHSFEREFASWVGTDYAITLANGTLALEVALKALGIGEGDEVIVTSRTFIASVSSIVIAGATPRFADVDPNSQNISPTSIKHALSSKTRAIICVHLAGWPCEMDAIMALAYEHDLYVIEDCAQAHGAMYSNQPVGSFGHIGAWSFCQDKIMTTGGEGGMVTTSDRSLWSKMWSYKDHGKSWSAVNARNHPAGFKWLHESFGTNMRMTETQAAIGRIQLQRMPEWHTTRRLNAEKILAVASEFDALRVPKLPSGIEHAWYKCYVFVESEYLNDGWSRDRIIDEINSNGVPCYSGSCSEVYLEKAFDNTHLRPIQRLPVARELGETSLMFLCHPTLKSSEIEKTCSVLRSVMNEAQR